MSYFWSGSEEMTFEFENLHYWYHSRYEMDPELTFPTLPPRSS